MSRSARRRTRQLPVDDKWVSLSPRSPRDRRMRKKRLNKNDSRIHTPRSSNLESSTPRERPRERSLLSRRVIVNAHAYVRVIATCVAYVRVIAAHTLVCNSSMLVLAPRGTHVGWSHRWVRTPTVITRSPVQLEAARLKFNAPPVQASVQPGLLSRPVDRWDAPELSTGTLTVTPSEYIFYPNRKKYNNTKIITVIYNNGNIALFFLLSSYNDHYEFIIIIVIGIVNGRIL